MKNAITLDTYPDMFTDYDSMTENENYDHERRLFTVPKDWAINWMKKNMGMDLDTFLSEYTYDDTMAMYEDAHASEAIISESIEAYGIEEVKE